MLKDELKDYCILTLATICCWLLIYLIWPSALVAAIYILTFSLACAVFWDLVIYPVYKYIRAE